MAIVFVEAADVPQELVAVTVISPPDDPAVTVIDRVLDEPVQPVGNVHVWVAPD
jgi:hypothetical protein